MITPCLWFDDDGGEAARFYVRVFREMGRSAEVYSDTPYGEDGMGEPGETMTVTFNLDGLDVMALNGGPHYKASPAFSLMIKCADQAEIDGFWTRLVEGGAPSRCGWLTDRFGVSWQVVPRDLEGWLSPSDPARAARVTRAFLAMEKFDLAAIEAAARGD
jgi:predicted 3-demethylubiquinone-9 3-methyltransferase (glyoxalase superfamily)